MCTNPVFAEHLFDEQDAFAQISDITEIISPKYVLETDGRSFDIYYGYYGSLDIDFEKEIDKAEVSKMNLNTERKSLEITISNNPADSIFWVRVPFEVLSAENEQYTVLIDGVDTGYDLTKYANVMAIGVIMPKDARHMEIIGTHIIPEFSTIVFLILTAGIVVSICFSKYRFYDKF